MGRIGSHGVSRGQRRLRYFSVDGPAVFAIPFIESIGSVTNFMVGSVLSRIPQGIKVEKLGEKQTLAADTRTVQAQNVQTVQCQALCR